MYFISQLGEQDCAFACLKMMLANYHKDRNYLYLTSPKGNAYSFQDLSNIAKEHQMTLRGIKISQPDELFKCSSFPIIVTLQRKKIRHSVLVIKANPKYVYVYDPAIGKRKINTELFFKEWNQRALIVFDFVKTKCKNVFPDFISRQDKISLPIFQVLSGISLLLGTYFISDSRIYLPIIFFSLFLVFELLFRRNLVGAMKRMDENIFSYQFKDAVFKDYSEIFINIEKYRVISLTIMPNFIYSCLIVIFISIILVMNNSLNAIYVFLPLILAAFQVFFYGPYFKNKEMEVVDKEGDILEAENDQQFKLLVTKARDESYKLGFRKNLITYFEIGILLIAIILTTTLSKTFNITYVVFYLCIAVFLKQQFVKIIENSSKDEEFDFVRAKLINSLDLDNKNS